MAENSRTGVDEANSCWPRAAQGLGPCSISDIRSVGLIASIVILEVFLHLHTRIAVKCN